jgi:Flp pilus assembly secretin CpaC
MTISHCRFPRNGKESPLRARFSLVSLGLVALLPAVVAAQVPVEDDPKDLVSIEVRVISTADDFFDRVGVDLGDEVKVDGKELICLDGKQVRKFLEAVQGDIRTNVMQAPRTIVKNGKTSMFRNVQTHRFVTGMKTIREGKNVVVIPKNETITTGLKMSMRPRIAADRRTIALNLKTTITNLDNDNVPMFPVVTPIMPVDKNGKPEKPVVFTQYLQQPQISTMALKHDLSIPNGGTVLFGGWKRISEGRNEYGPPVLSKVPYVNRLFKNVSYTRSKENVLVMVTAKIVPMKTAAAYLKQFNELYQQGKYEEAHAAALQARELARDDSTIAPHIAEAAVAISEAAQRRSTKSTPYFPSKWHDD